MKDLEMASKCAASSYKSLDLAKAMEEIAADIYLHEDRSMGESLLFTAKLMLRNSEQLARLAQTFYEKGKSYESEINKA